MPELDIFKDYIQLGFAGFSVLLLGLVFWVLRMGNKERKEFRVIMNDTQHQTIKVIDSCSKSYNKVARALGRLERTLDNKTPKRGRKN